MRKTLIVARREYLAAVRTRSFLISLVLMPVLMSGSLIGQLLLGDQKDLQDKRFAVVDRSGSGQLAEAIVEAAEVRNREQTTDPETDELIAPAFLIERVDPPANTDTNSLDQLRLDLSERVRSGELVGFLEIGSQVLNAPPIAPTMVEVAGTAPDPPSDETLAGDGPVEPEPSEEQTQAAIEPDDYGLRYQSNTPTYMDFRNWARLVVIEQVQRARADALGLSYEQVQAVMSPLPLRSAGLTERVTTDGQAKTEEQNEVAVLLRPIALMMLMFMIILIGSTPLMQGVIEEKTQRIAEVLLGSVRPIELMTGKLLGMVGVSLTILTVYLGGAAYALHSFGYGDLITMELMAWFAFFQVLAILMFGALFVAVGAAVSDSKEAQTMVAPVMLLVALPMFAMSVVLREPNSSFATGLSLFPTATPMLMIMRMSIPPGVPSWQLLIGSLGTMLTTLAFLYAGGRIFRVGILMQGKGADIRQMIRWVFTS